MRMLLRVCVDVEVGNRAVRDGSLARVFNHLFETAKPESAYFTTDGGRRTAYYFIDVKDSSWIPSLAEPLFQELGARVELLPAMNRDELARGLEAWRKK